jgi:DNA-binding transcriptional regulator YiaG
LTITNDYRYCCRVMTTDMLTRVGMIDRDLDAEAQELRDLRNELELTQLDVARMIDVTPGTYSEWERGVRECQYAALQLLRCRVRERKAQSQPTTKRRR